ncbi:hypothetical protein M9H77_08351 [Catharanthus roseus]|uniref:Uncharacterized protein n=1 Tax=Catharanthus roseus TaxID=4058 RepID=A0ACC0BXJ2_CATRO|nr:hypothetical protein M9H77_08351 [Catharanthus roseus]
MKKCTNLKNRNSATTLINQDREIDSYGFSDSQTTKIEKDENKERYKLNKKFENAPRHSSLESLDLKPGLDTEAENSTKHSKPKQKTKPNKINQKKNKKEKDDQAILPWTDLWNSAFLEDMEYREVRLVSGTIKGTKML